MTVDVEEDGEAVVIRVSGELDMSTTGMLDVALHETLDGEASMVTLDLSGLSFIDSSGLRLLTNAASHPRADGTRLRMRGRSKAVERTFEVTGLDHSLPFTD